MEMEGKRVRWQRDREKESVCVRGSAWWKRRDSVGHKMTRWRNISGEINVGLILRD